MGDPTAQYNLAVMYYYGNVLQQDYGEAARLFRQAIDGGVMKAAANLGLMYFKGEGVSVDYAEAIKLFRLGAEGGDSTAQLCLANAYATGNQVSKDAMEAAKWYRLSADQGNPTAQFNIGNALFEGNGVPVDPAEAGIWWYRSAIQGNAKAKANLTNLGIWKRVADSRTLDWQCWLGFALMANGNGKEGFAFIRKTAEAGFLYAQMFLAMAYYDGRFLGYSLSKDLKAAFSWTGLAASQGDAASQYNLAMDYFLGEGTERNTGKALEWFLMAASQGYVDAYFNLGSLFYEAARKLEGENRDTALVKAYMFFLLAAEEGRDDTGRAEARAAAVKAALLMKPEQVEEAKRQAGLYRK